MTRPLSYSHFDRFSRLLLLQSRLHEVWARFFASSMKDDLATLRPTASRPFPFPEDFETNPALEAAGQVLLRVPRRSDGPQQRGPDQDLQPLPRPRRTLARHPQAPRAARRDGQGRPRSLRLARPRRVGHLRVPPRLRGGRGRRRERTAAVAARSPGATAGPTTSATRSSPACSNSIASAPKRNA